MVKIEKDTVYRTTELAKMFKVQRQTIYNWQRKGLAIRNGWVSGNNLMEYMEKKEKANELK